MADDSEDLRNFNEKLKFHPTDTPRGSLYYDTTILTDEQQIKLNDLKIQNNRDDEIYLANNPEIRACIALVVRYVTKFRPRKKLHEFIGKWFKRSRTDIDNEVKAYIEQRGPHNYEGNSAVVTPTQSYMQVFLDEPENSFYEDDLYDFKPEVDTETYMRNLINAKISDLPSIHSSQNALFESFLEPVNTDSLEGAEEEQYFQNPDIDLYLNTNNPSTYFDVAEVHGDDVIIPEENRLKPQTSELFYTDET